MRNDITLEHLIDAVSNDLGVNKLTATKKIISIMEEFNFPHGTEGKSGRFYIQGWDCEESPIGTCIGDSEEPECPCVFCRDPEERK